MTRRVLAPAMWCATLLLLLLVGPVIAAGDASADPGAIAEGVGFAGFILGMATLGVLITRRESRNAVGWLLCAVPLLLATSVSGGAYAEWAGAHRPGAPLAAWLTNLCWPVALVGYALLIPLLFPDGRPPGRRWRLLLWADLAVVALLLVLLAVQPGETTGGYQNPLGVAGADGVPIAAVAALVLVLVPVGLASAVVRYRRADLTQRLQLRECVLAACLSFIGFFVISVLAPYELLYTADYALLPLAVGLAMLRYRLYDVDVIIRRTLTYVGLVGALAVIYLSGVAAIGWALRSVSGQSSALAVTASTLAAAAAFQPLRSRIQRAVDRRFYRARYDAQGVADAFAGRLRAQLDLDALHRELLAAASGAVRPQHASLWLRTVTIPERPSGTQEET